MADVPKMLEGFQAWGGDEPFEEHAGPFFMKLDTSDAHKHLSAFIAQAHHMNGGGFLHGGMIMSFADFALFVIAYDALDGAHAVTVSCQTDFLQAAAPIGEIVYADGEVTRSTGAMVFVRGQVYHADTTLATFSGILKRVRS